MNYDLDVNERLLAGHHGADVTAMLCEGSVFQHYVSDCYCEKINTYTLRKNTQIVTCATFTPLVSSLLAIYKKK